MFKQPPPPLHEVEVSFVISLGVAEALGTKTTEFCHFV